jgi:hypothetical protein
MGEMPWWTVKEGAATTGCVIAAKAADSYASGIATIALTIIVAITLISISKGDDRKTIIPLAYFVAGLWSWWHMHLQ